MICPSGQGQSCPHGEAGCFPTCRFDTDDLGNAYEQAASSFWKSDLPQPCDFGTDWPFALKTGFIQAFRDALALLPWAALAGVAVGLVALTVFYK